MMKTSDDIAREWQRLILQGHGGELYDRMMQVSVDISQYAAAVQSRIALRARWSKLKQIDGEP